MKLSTYINMFYKGNLSAFARDNELNRQQITKCLKAGHYYVINVDGGLSLIPVAKGKKLKVDKMNAEKIDSDFTGGMG